MRFKVLTLAACMAMVPGCTQRGAKVASVPPSPSPAPAAATPAPGPDLASRLAVQADDADPDVLRMALQAQQCAARRGDVAPGGRLAVIDYSRPSTQRRLWVFDLSREALLYSEHVAHGRNTGDNFATRFSNVEGSLQSSLGLFRTAETYIGENGYSMRMDGLERGVNDLARPRAIVMHGAWYVDPLQATRQGRLGRSLGCPAVRPAVAREVIDTLKQGQLLFAYYPDRAWLDSSPYLDCRPDEPRQPRIAAVHVPAR